MTPISTAAPVSAKERSMLLGQLRLGKTGTQLLSILDVITADIAQPLKYNDCLLYTSPSPRDLSTSRMPSSA